MKTKSFKITIPFLVILCIFLKPIFTYAETELENKSEVKSETAATTGSETKAETTTEATTETYFNCIDNHGNQIMTNLPVEGSTCEPVGVFHRITAEENIQIEQERKVREARIAREEEEARQARIRQEEERQRQYEEWRKEERIRQLERETAEAEAKAAANRAWNDAQDARIKADQAQQQAEQADDLFWVNGKYCRKFGNYISCY